MPGHDNCAAVTMPLAARYEPASGPYGWQHVERQNRLVASVFDRVAPGRVALLDAFAVSNARADRHIALKTRMQTLADGTVVRTEVADCLHYCLPSVVDTWNVLLGPLLKSASRFRAW